MSICIVVADVFEQAAVAVLDGINTKQKREDYKYTYTNKKPLVDFRSSEISWSSNEKGQKSHLHIEAE